MKKLKTKLVRFWSDGSKTKRVSAVIFALLFAGVMTYFLARALASSSFVVFNPETSQLQNGAVRGSDSKAVGGQFVQFGQAPNVTFASQCLKRSGTTIMVSSQLKGQYRDQQTKKNTIFEASGASWDGVSAAGNPVPWVINLAGEGPACWYGGRYQGVWDDTSPDVTWEDPYHHAGALTVNIPNFLVEGLRVDNQGDGIRPIKTANNFHVRGVHLSNIHDDCIENDWLFSGIVEDSLFDGCYVAFSARTKPDPPVTGAGQTMRIEKNLVYLKPMPTVFRGVVPGTGPLFKWVIPGVEGPAVVLNDNIFRIDQKASHGQIGIPELMDLKSCRSNTIVWLGEGEFPHDMPSCFTITRDIKVWNNAVKQWKLTHPDAL